MELDAEAGIHAAAEALAGGRSVVLTGAGMSTDSGIPDYRGAGGDQRRSPPITYREFMGDPEARRRYWARSQAGFRHVVRARPNASHHAVTALQDAGLVHTVITQNVDRLHSRAGTRDVLELHGRIDRVVCTSCGDRRDRELVRDRLAATNPRFEATLDAVSTPFAPDGDADLADALLTEFRIVDCHICRGILKPDVVFFGESMPRSRRIAAEQAVADSDGLLVLGSSLAVMSGYRLVLQAASAGLPITVLTRGPTRGDHLARVRIDAGLAASLPALLTALEVDTAGIQT